MKISDKQLELIASKAAAAALEHLEKEKKKQEKQKYDRRLRNVKLLLRNYRSLAKHVGDIKLEIDILNEKFELAYLDSDEFRILTIKRSKEKTLAMVRYIDKMLAVYKVMCEEEGEEAKRRYRVINDSYIKIPQKTILEISNVHFVSEKTIRRDREKAFEDLSVLMFGIDAIRLK